MTSGCRAAVLGSYLLAGWLQAALAEEWGFSSPDGAVVKVSRGSDLSLEGSMALPTPDGRRVTVPVTGWNEPGRIFLKFDDPVSGRPSAVSYQREKLSNDGYTIWRADDGPATLRELRAPVNVVSEAAKSALQSWGGDTRALIPIDTFVQMRTANRQFAAKSAIAAERDDGDGAEIPVAVVTERPNAAAWEVAAAETGSSLESLHTFQNKYDGVLFTINDRELIAALSKDEELLRDFGGLARTSIPVTSHPNVHSFSVPLRNLFDTYSVERYNLDRVRPELEDLFGRMRSWKIACEYGEPRIGMFSATCVHHTSDHQLTGDFFVSTTFTFSIGELWNNERQIFVAAESFGASAKSSDRPRRDRYTYTMYQQAPVKNAHDVAIEVLCSSLREMYSGFRRN
jgi:hypothetical protein